MMRHSSSNQKPYRTWLPLLLAALLLGLPAGSGPGADGDLQPEVENFLRSAETRPETIRVVSFNVHYAENLPALIESIRGNPALRSADVFLLQEIESYESEGTSRARKLAEALDLNYVYGPARPTETGGTHGLAILSRFPVGEVQVLPLKQFDLNVNTRRRIALAATLDVAGRPLRVYNVHLDTRINTGDRIEQLRPVVEAAQEHASAVIIGGDFNTNPIRWLFHVVPVFRSNQAQAIDDFMRESSFETPFADDGATSRKPLLRMRIDALYPKGLGVIESGVERSVEVSDHYPLWLEVAWLPKKGEEQR